MAIRKRTRSTDGVTVYWIDYRTPGGTRVREKAGYSREAAKRLLQNRLAEAGPDRNRKSATPFRTFAKLYLERHAAMRKRPEWYRWLTDTMIAEFGDTPLRNVTAFRVQGYINRLTVRDDQDQIVNGTTLGHHRQAVHNVFGRAVEWGYLSVTPVKAVKTPRATEPRARYLTPDEADRLIAACPRDGLNRKGRPTRGGEIRHLIRLMLNTALRPGEAVALRWADVYLDQNPPHLLVSASKSGRPRWVPLNA